jgi:hypothetical protein
MQLVEAAKQNRWASRLILAVGIAAILGLGCERRLTIRQDGYINNAMQPNRPPARRTGEPLELTVVCVLPRDLKDDNTANADLKPGANINSRIWYARRPGAQLAPKPGEAVAPPFNIAATQIFVLDENNADATLRPLHGKTIEGHDRELKVTDKMLKFEIPALDLFSKNCIVYVFGKFADENGDILPVPPAVFTPPGDYKSELFIKVGSSGDWNSPTRGQYIKNITKPGSSGGEITN